MIDKQFGDYVLVCDVCEEEAEEHYDTFQDAITGIKELGWKSEKHNKGWKHICPNCREDTTEEIKKLYEK